MHDLTAAIKQGLIHKRLVLALVELALVSQQAVVDRIRERQLHLAHRRRLAAGAPQPLGEHDLAEFLEAKVSRRVHLEHLSHQRPMHRVRCDGPRDTVIDVSERRGLRPDAAHDLVSLAAGDVLAQIVHVVLRLAQHDAQHELALGRRLEAERRKPQVFEQSQVNEVNHPARIHRVASQAVWVPRDDAGGFAPLDAVHHRVEDRSAGDLGALLLREDLDDVEPLTRSQELGLRELVPDRPELP
ncbi:MAG: hypothetical protein SFY96_03410 [Planctomycetota bacterium]|nr:hypothetical protein [Planctomycetota bacterium]